MRLVLLACHLHLPGSRSLKDKRRVVKGLKDSLRAHFNVSVAEVEHQDLHQSATLAVAWVAADGSATDQLASRIESLVCGRSGAELLRIERFEY